MKKISDIRAAGEEVKRKLTTLHVVTDDLGQAPKVSGQDHFWCCPLHGEKTPSLAVHMQTQIFKCFGCGKGGDVLRWTQAYNNLSYTDAVLLLAERYAIDLSAFERPLTQEEIQTQRYYDIFNRVSAYCNTQMLNNKAVLNWYLQDSGFDIEKIVDYEVGYSHSSDELVKYLFSTIPNITQTEIDVLELTNKLMWNNSIVYPIKAHDGKTARFHNKPLTPPSDWGGKYVGTSGKHPLFQHGLFFGFNVARKELRNNGYSLRVVEGQKGAIACGGVAILGSTIHEEQIRVLQEHLVKEIRIAFDGDDAGRTASMRMLDQIGLMTAMHVLMAKLPSDKQPDDIMRIEGKAGLDKLFDSAVIPVQYYVESKLETIENTTDKFVIVHELKTFLSSLPELHLDLTANYLSKALEVDPNSIKSFVSELKLVQSGLVNRDVEHAVLRHIIMVPRAWSTARQAITEFKAFTVPGYQYLFGALSSVHKKARGASGADSVTAQSLKDEITAMFPQFKELPLVVDTVLATESKYEYIDALQRMVDLYRRRMGIEQSKLFASFLQDLSKNANDMVSKFRRQLVSSLDVRRDDISTPVDLADRVMKELYERMHKQTSIIGYDFSTILDIDDKPISCLAGLTLALSGLQTKHQVIISANTGVGKSLLALQMAISISICPHPEDQVPILWIPLEMNEIEITFRIISLLTGINNDRVQSGQFTTTEFIRVQAALDKIAKSQFYIKKPRFGHADEIFSIIEEYHFKYGIKAVFTDYIQLIAYGENDKKLAKHDLYGQASKMLKNQVAENMDVVSVCIAQLNRTDFRQGEVRKTENMGGSYEVSQDADDLLTMMEKTDAQISDEKGMRGNRLIFLDKRRGGSSDVMIHAELDTNITKNLRFVEKMPPEQMLGLLKGMKINENDVKR